jgi:hypothetical protein
MSSNSNLSNGVDTLQPDLQHSELDRFAEVANTVADAAGEVIRKYFRKKFEILDKEDLSKLLNLKFLLAFVWIFVLLCLVDEKFEENEKNGFLFWVVFRGQKMFLIIIVVKS